MNTTLTKDFFCFLVFLKNTQTKRIDGNNFWTTLEDPSKQFIKLKVHETDTPKSYLQFL